MKMRIKPLALAVPMIALSAALAACGGSDDDNDKTPQAQTPPEQTTPGQTPPVETPKPQKFTAGLYGDVPYGIPSTDPALPAGVDLTEFKKMPAYLANINADKDLSVVVHVGDLHSGSEACTQVYDNAIAGFFKTLTLPLVYTPGDNEWEDCQVPKEIAGKYSETVPELGNVAGVSQPSYMDGNPVDNLALIRQLFFPVPGKTLGSGTLTVHSQATEGKTDTDKQFVENVWWMNQGVLFVVVNIPGGSNNGTDVWGSGAKPATPQPATAQQTEEVTNRSAATRNWLTNAFDQADAQKASAVVILEQADMWSSENAIHDSRLSEYKQYIDIIANRTTQFGKPVLLVNGDTHLFQSDNPLMVNQTCVKEDLSAPGAEAGPCGFDPYSRNAEGTTYNVKNFHRVVVHGQTLPMEWTKLTVDPAGKAANSSYAYGPFSWERHFVN